MKIFELRQLVGNIFNMENKSFALYCEEVELSNNAASIKEYKIKRDSIIKLKKLIKSEMPYADPADVMPSLLLMRTAMKWQKSDVVANSSHINNALPVSEIQVKVYYIINHLGRVKRRST